jgi:pyruvate dehydrogenase E2 component (dihydrolipoamide acetyltransferase)
MATNVLMPKMGYDMTEGKILRWLKQEGDAVNKGEPIAEIQTDKVNIEIEAFAGGVLAKILHGADEDVAVGEVIGIIAAPGEKVEAPAKAPSAGQALANNGSGLDMAQSGEGGEAVGMDVGAGTGARANATATTSTIEEPSRVKQADADAKRAAAGAQPPVRPEGERVKASPLARKMAAAQGVELAEVPGTGPGGRIVKRDVEGYKPVQKPAAFVPQAAVTEVPLTRMRQAIARRLSESKQTAPHFYVTKAIDMTEAVAFRAQVNQTLTGAQKVSFNDMVIKAVAKALKTYPNVNASWAEDRIVQHEVINVGMAVALPEGLVVPVITDAYGKTLSQIAESAKDLAARAKENRLRPDEFSGGTCTISNLGMFDVESFTAIINPPESAILAVGSIVKEPVVRDDEVVVRSMMRITISSDHRVIDGALAAQFLGEVKRLLETPLLLVV